MDELFTLSVHSDVAEFCGVILAGVRVRAPLKII